ncbi:MAG: hypothetical protein QOF25_2309 [Mycobacterium sp.]|nr:hypothetical protein [Mycobacterium sp.]
MLPDVYGPRRGALSLPERTTAAWLWSKREGVVSGLAASAALGAKWVDVDTAIELNWSNNRPPIGVVTRRASLLDDEVALLQGMAVTTADRTAFDLALRGSVGQAVARLDALASATHFKAEDVQAVAMRHPHVRGLRRVDRALDLVDAGAESPKETWLRLLLIDAGFPRPQTQIPVLGPDGYPLYYLDMGWEDMVIAVEYDGDDHRERPRWGRDIVRSEYIAHLGWTHIRVVAGNSRPEIVQRVNRAWALR